MIKQWLDRRRERREAQAYEDGFAWACVEVLGKHKPLSLAQHQLAEGAGWSAEAGSFDQGATDALDAIERLSRCPQ